MGLLSIVKDCMGSVVSLVGPQSGWLPGPDLWEGCWLVGSGQEAADCGTPGSLGLVLGYLWAKSGSRRSQGYCPHSGG